MSKSAGKILILSEHTVTCMEKYSKTQQPMKRCASKGPLNSGSTVVVTRKSKSWPFMAQQVSGTRLIKRPLNTVFFLHDFSIIITFCKHVVANVILVPCSVN